MYQQLTRASGAQNNTVTMMLFALVEVVMIVVGIVMANRLEQQKELNDVMEDAKVLLLEVLDDLDGDIATSATVIRHHATASELADIARQAAYPSYTNPPTPSGPGAPVDDSKSMLNNSCPPRSAPRRAFIDALKHAAQPPSRRAALAASSSHDTQPPMVATRRGLPESSQRAMILAYASKPHGFTAAMLRLIGR